MELQEYTSMEQMLHKAILIEQQAKRKGYSKPAFAPKPSYQDKGKSPITTNTTVELTPRFMLTKAKQLRLTIGQETSSAIDVKALATMPASVRTRK